jgi:hypothetical protein
MDFPGFLPGRCYLKRTDVIDGIEEFGPLADLIVTSPPYDVSGKAHGFSRGMRANMWESQSVGR